MRQKRGECLKEADLIILAGSVCDFRLSYGRSLNKKAKIIAINRDKVQLYKVKLFRLLFFPVFLEAGLGDFFFLIKKKSNNLRLLIFLIFINFGDFIDLNNDASTFLLIMAPFFLL